MIRTSIKYLLLFSLLAICTYSNAQEKKRIKLQQADEIRYDKKVNKDVQILSGNVILEHDSVILHCDSAYLNDVSNRVEAFSNIHIIANDSLNMYGNYLKYDGNTRIAEIFENVKLIDNQTTLVTDHLYYNRNTEVCYYLNGGTITSEDNELVSQKGYYYPNTKEFFFRENVKLTNPDYYMEGDTLMYNTGSEIAYFMGPTIIVSEEDYIFCNTGWYDTKTDISQYGINTIVRTGAQILFADSIYYEQKRGYGLAYGNISLTDTVQNIILKGQFSEYDKKLGYTIITDSAMAIMIDEADSLFLHADTLKATFDDDQKTESMFAYHKTKFYREDLQGMCDSLYYDFVDSVINLYHSPVLWSDENQLTADSIKIWIKDKQVNRLTLHNSSFIISQDDTSRYNQIKGLDMVGYFIDNELRRIEVSSNSETIYYVREEDESLIGINKAVSGNMSIRVKDSKVERITYIDNPSATLYPEKDIPASELKLDGFIWYEGKRPLTKEDIFFW